MILVIILLQMPLLILIVMLAGLGSANPCSCHRCGKYVPAPARFCDGCRPAPLSGYQPSKTTLSGKVQPPPKQR
ncbi:TPA: hypothetical protein O8U57_001981 [Enterobacter asburiae]|uniref:hypothetical protein n=1 Tax=Citrobacter freundii TaxID=546 RepID=UPI000D3B8965|nr:hypothetical protein [Citrobacter freundii]HBM7610144.1 hypothetical protein [Enterobacter asburiae]EKT9265269.1 hypothetical protein [Citrobacter freundii]EKW0743258.1 hypothetical protein [Citrobacter freundii]EKW0770163.1 hypothetical protein [Citrobacter freundii]MEC5591536.1 hypothetical protein [Citrobacter freundii]